LPDPQDNPVLDEFPELFGNIPFTGPPIKCDRDDPLPKDDPCWLGWDMAELSRDFS
jgi:hypothetical protein